MKPTATMLRRPDLKTYLPGSAQAAPEQQAAAPEGDPIAERRAALVRALGETLTEIEAKTITQRIEDKLEARSKAWVEKPPALSGRIAARLVGYDEADECEPIGRLPLAGVAVRLVIDGRQPESMTTGSVGEVLFEFPEGGEGPYLLEFLLPGGEVFTSVEGDWGPNRGESQLVEAGRLQDLEPAFARGRNLILAAGRAQKRAVELVAKVGRALERQEEDLRAEIAALDAIAATTESQAKGDSDGSDAQN